jgi:hypothetical protein
MKTTVKLLASVVALCIVPATYAITLNKQLQTLRVRNNSPILRINRIARHV